MKSAVVILGDQLFSPARLRGWEGRPVFMAEDLGLATRTRHHKIKLAFFFSAMRAHARELSTLGWAVEYHPIDAADASRPFEDKLRKFMRRHAATGLSMFEVEDKFFEARLVEFCRREGWALEFKASPMFLTSRQEFERHLSGRKKPFMKNFYEESRRRLGVLTTLEGEPVGGRWSFDTENREPLPRDFQAPPAPRSRPSEADAEVIELVERLFPDHPGSARDLWLPTDRAGWRRWLNEFLKQRFALFGPVEDALSPDHPILAHSVLSPALNVGLLEPQEVIDAALAHAKKERIEMRSLEGFVRQVIGWREFVRGVYRAHSEHQETANAWGHHRTLAPCWRDGTTGILPIDLAIRKTLRLGWAHHIERLMVLSSAMFLCEIEPRAAHDWFMEMFVDSADWVMGPNVYGMGQNADGGLMTTKPYLCASNYLLKMGRYPKGPWCEELDGLYWRWILKNKAVLVRNPRMAQTARGSERLKPARVAVLSAAADRALARLTRSSI